MGAECSHQPPAIILVGCQIPGNLGAVARAMGNFGASDLRLVGGCTPSDPEAVARAREMVPILAAARGCATLKEALTDLHHAFAATHRRGRGRTPPLLPAAAMAQAAALPGGEGWALVFGNETSGLSNDEVLHCDHLVAIPTQAAHPSLNLSHAVTILLYAWTISDRRPPVPVATLPASAAERRGLYEHMAETMLRTGYLDPLNPDRTLRHLARLLYRARPTPFEITLLRGFFRKLGHLADRAGRPSAAELIRTYEEEAARHRTVPPPAPS
ncbi:MAG: hypothetical protein CO080_08470 [Nitrospirae bacterium CG_4_9_14_0_8_um_filter_70_14]|nr:MAG: hypothetical protein CO080_08470 [Nitrospirae bacterium CG_4_9_14_0_8_um_filter_70_14]